jgi:hypothetical protein
MKASASAMWEKLSATEHIVNGKKYRSLNFIENFYEIIFYHCNATRKVPHLNPQPMFEDYQFDPPDTNLTERHRLLETIDLPILLSEDGDELCPKTVVEIFAINTDLVEGHTVFKDRCGYETKMWDELNWMKGALFQKEKSSRLRNDSIQLAG